MIRLFCYKFFRNIAKCFWGKNLLWHALAIALTYACVTSGFDWFYFEHTRSSALFAYALPAAILGFFVPIIAPVLLYFVGKVRGNARMQHAGAAVAQAGAIGWLISSTYKAFTGRMQPYYTPYYNDHIPSADISHQFNFGFFQHGIFWGWPSSHTAVAFAESVALVYMLRGKNKLLSAAVLLYALYIGVGVSMSIHWFSDALAGAIIGSVVGVVVAKSFLDTKISTT